MLLLALSPAHIHALGLHVDLLVPPADVTRVHPVTPPRLSCQPNSRSKERLRQYARRGLSPGDVFTANRRSPELLMIAHDVCKIYRDRAMYGITPGV
jgi:hypothetical protein